MIEDPIVKEIRKYRQEHSKKYGYDLNRICDALIKKEKKSGKKVVDLAPRLLLAKTGS